MRMQNQSIKNIIGQEVCLEIGLEELTGVQTCALPILNPIYHGFVSKLNEFKHSSYLSLISDDETFIEKEEVIHLFNDTENFIFYLNTQKIEFDDKLKELILE